MVVSADSQKILKKKRRYKSKTVSHYNRQRIGRLNSSSLKVVRKPVSLFMLPFISALFVFSLYINISDSYWIIREPSFTLDDLSFPEENIVTEQRERILKASIENSYLYNENTSDESHQKYFFTTPYTIRDDDRYSTLANKFNITIDSLISINGITSVGKPLPGSIINIPNLSGIIYPVEKGDTLSSISIKYNIEVDEIQLANNLHSSIIHIGETIFLPNVSMDSDKIEKIIGSKFVIPSSGAVKNNHGSYLDPGTGLKNYNYGIDIINNKGTAVYAAKDGIVSNTAYNSYYGRVVLLNHSNYFQSMYSCLDSIAVKPGQSVKRGQLLGYIGNSGFKSSEHLQFSIFKNKEDVDTLEYIF